MNRPYSQAFDQTSHQRASPITRTLSLLGAILIATAAPRAAVAQSAGGSLGLRSAWTIQPASLATQPSLNSALALPRAGGHGQAMTLMIVGGAGMIGGLLINDSAGNAIAIGGLLVGLYGLYLYLR